MLRLTFPGVLLNKRFLFSFEGTGIICFPFFCLWLAAAIGWFMNFQNIWQWWPETNKLGDVGFEWFISLLGILLPPMGAITGWMY